MSLPTGIERTLVVDGKRLESFWLPAASRDRPTIVLLHEGLGSIALWKDFPWLLAERTNCGVFVYSRYGYGRSSPLEAKRTPDYLHHEGESVLPQVLEQAGIERPILFGHSDGASIAIIYGGRFAQRPKGLILEAPHVFVETKGIESIARTTTAFAAGELPPRLARYHQDVDRTFYGWSDIWLDPDFRTWNIESYLSRIECPTLVIQGADDEYGTLEQCERIVKQAQTAKLEVLPDCGHSPHRDQLEATLRLSAEFVERVAPIDA